MEVNYTIKAHKPEQQEIVEVQMQFAVHDHTISECESDDEAVEGVCAMIEDHSRNNTFTDYSAEIIRREVRRIRELHGMPE